METRPPELIEAIVAHLIPPACRENVVGDCAERYKSPAQYLFGALSALPFIVASQILRTFRLAAFFSQAAVLYFAFAGASVAGSGALNKQPLLPLAILIGIALFVLVVRDAYADPQEQPARRALRDVGFSIGIAICCEGLLRDLQLLNLALPPWVVLAGSAVSIPMLYMVRRFFQPRKDFVAPASGPTSSLNEHQKAWQLNLVWVMAGLIVIFTSPRIRVPNPTSGLNGLFLIAILGVSFWRHKNGFTGPRQEYTALSISRDPYRNQLARKRDGLRSWAGGVLFSSGGVGATIILVLIAFPFAALLFGWIIGRPLPANVNPTHVSLSLIAFAILSAFWVFVRSRSLRAAQTIQDELDRLEAEDKKQ
jgi:hypothetical protein